MIDEIAEQANEEIEELEQAPEVEAIEPDDDEDVIQLEGESQPPEDDEHENAPLWVKEVRKTNRTLSRENRELQRKLSELTTENKPVAVSVKPTLAACEYDEDDYEAKLAQWYADKAQADAAAELERKAAEAQQQEWQTQLKRYADAKAALKMRDFEEAEAAVLEALSVTQQGVVVQAADNAANIVGYLGKNPTKLAELAGIKNPVEFTKAIVKLEARMTVTKRQPPPPPEKTIAGSGRGVQSNDSKLEQLMAEADRTGDRTKVAAYRRQLKSN